MRKKKVWRYWCDFCGKGGCSASSMVKHEKHCTMNPNRICGFCKREELEQKPIAILIAAYDKDTLETTNNLREAADGCPACMLSAIRQWKGQNNRPVSEAWDRWNYKQEVERFWNDYKAGREY
jgi:hypothetical protein